MDKGTSTEAKTLAKEKVIDKCQHVYKYYFVPNCRGRQIANFGKKNHSSSFNYYKRMT